MASSLTAVVVGTAIMLFSNGAVLAGKEMEYGKVSEEEWQTPAPSDYPEANAVVLQSRAHLEIKDTYIITDYHYRIKILTAAGVEKVGDQSIVWNKEYDRIKKFKAQTITRDGKKYKVEDNAIFTKEKGDYREKTFTFPALEPGCIMEYCYTAINENFYYLEPWYFQTDIYTLKSSFSVSIPNGFVYNVLYQNVPAWFQQPKVEERPDLDGDLSKGATIKTFTWERENLPPITDEPYMSSEYDYRSSLRFQIVSFEYRGISHNLWENWEEKGDLAQRWLDEYCDSRKQAKELAERITAGLSMPSEKSRAIYNFVATEYRTIYDYSHGYFNHERMSQLLETKSGTGEEKNLLLVQMHQAAGIQSWPVLISTRDVARLDPQYPDLRQFNYIVAFVQFDRGFEYLDCSGKLSPYGVLPPNCLTNGGLLVDGKNSQLVRVQQSALYSGRTDYTRMLINGDGSAACNTTCSFRGYYASYYGGRYERKTPKDFVDEYFLSRLGGEYTLGTYNCNLESDDSFLMTADYTARDLVTPLDNNLLVRPVAYAFRTNPFESRRRFFPVDFNYPFTFKNIAEVFFADSASQLILPQDTTFAIDGASYARVSRRTDSSVVITSTMIIAKPEFLPQVYAELRGFFDQVAAASEDEVIATLASSAR